MSSYVCPTHGVGPICQDCVNGVGRPDGWTPNFTIGQAIQDHQRDAHLQAEAAAAWAQVGQPQQPQYYTPQPMQAPRVIEQRSPASKGAEVFAWGMAGIAISAFMRHQAADKYRKEHTTWQRDYYGNLIEVLPPEDQVQAHARGVMRKFWTRWWIGMALFMVALVVFWNVMAPSDAESRVERQDYWSGYCAEYGVASFGSYDACLRSGPRS